MKMSRFDNHLHQISNNIANDNHWVNEQGFLEVKNYVLDIMRKQDSYFNDICHNDVLFGSQAHEIRIYNDDEYDVLMELEFPAYSHIRQVKDKYRPGYEFLDFSEACYDDMIGSNLANNQNMFLNRARLKRWLHNLFINALDNFGNMFSGAFEDFELSYEWRGITYTIEAVSDMRTFTIDFVPAVKIARPNSSSDTWHAIPKGTSGPNNTNRFTFMISNSQAELNSLARCGGRLRDALRLLQALRNTKKMPMLRCYHFVTLAMWMASREGHYNVSQMSISEIFLMLLSDLCDAFDERHLSYVWNSQMNLLATFNSGEITQYRNKLCSVYNTLSGYPYEGNLTYKRCASHFD